MGLETLAVLLQLDYFVFAIVETLVRVENGFIRRLVSVEGQISIHADFIIN